MTHLVLSGLTKSFGAAPVVDQVDLTIEEGEAVVLLGPSGCGKTTCLRMIAGFERPDAGEIRLRDKVLAGPRMFIPPERRQMSVVFQSYALWPHLSVRENVGYGPTTAKVSRPEVRRRTDEALAMVQLDGLADRYAHQLSGGQQQRVALARALVNDPALLLLDEPLSNLDTRLREEMRSEIKRIHRSLGVTMVYVTHDQAEALSLADRLVVMHAGRIVQVGAPEEVYRRPRTGFVARALGATNLLPATVCGPPSADGVPLRLPGGITVTAPRSADVALQAGDEVSVSIRPVDLRLTSGSAGAAGGARVSEALFFGDHVQYAVDLPGLAEPLKATGPSLGRFDAGQDVVVEVDGTAVAIVSDGPGASVPGRDDHRPGPSATGGATPAPAPARRSAA
ncbi:iron(III) transport system ATP-binding protein [Blastococcus sp. DSM 46786]|uniref:ABC transporter ATP-binding protein n=1 Tax=Blastococcus sp. DSM 46786 TaxID=1798227 RepID=UPI0008C11BE9|nr:ABC transporter ATP-binding protein [Blastococcus sp. DSM 46786]SEK99377.1 iron(III) transport system ATP-binding protein [Blastococcus sp. DSM 46786]